MANHYFQFKEFTIYHDRCAMKVTTDGCLFGAWCAITIQEGSSKQRILDIGSGTGLLSLMVAQKNDTKIDAVEIDKDAALQARDNIAKSSFLNNISIHQQDIRIWKEEEYDCIICNPPFYENELRSDDESKNLAHHSEALSLKQLFEIISAQLKSNGSFYLLLPYKRFTEIERLLRQEKLYPDLLVIVHPTTEHIPFRLMIKGNKHEKTKEIQHLYIKDADGCYTPDFVNLLKDYYLYL